jgi:hypothetical protein
MKSTSTTTSTGAKGEAHAPTAVTSRRATLKGLTGSLSQAPERCRL